MRTTKNLAALAAALLAPLTLGGCSDPIPGLWVGAIPAAIWLWLFCIAIFAVLASVQNAIWSLIYLAGRRGNDDLPSRDALLARRALEAAPAAAPATAPVSREELQ